MLFRPPTEKREKTFPKWMFPLTFCLALLIFWFSPADDPADGD